MQNEAVRVGTSLTSTYLVDDPREGARRMIERARAARDAGLELLSVGDHHVTGPIPYYQNTAILGRLLADWPDDRPAGALYLLPLWNPVLVAEQVGTLAAIGGRRFVLQCAIGGGEDQFRGMGASMKGRAARFEAALETITSLLAGEEVDGARVAPVPAQPVEVWIGGSAPKAIDRAARMGDAWYAGPELVLDQARELMDIYRERCGEHAREPACIPIRKDVHVGADRDEVDRIVGPLVEKGYRGFDPAALVSGTVDEVVGQLQPYAEAGFTDVIVRQLAQDQGDALASLERLAEVRQHLAAS